MIDTQKCLGTCAYLGGVWAVPEDFCWTWGALREFTRDYLTGVGEVVHYTRAKFSLHASARNWLVQEMRGDWLWMTDTDHIVEPDCVYKLVRLMQQYNTPVLSGIYRHKALPHHPMLWHWSDTEQGFLPFAEYDASTPVFRVDAVGAGCLLIHRRVFARLTQVFPTEEAFEHRGKYGEDMSFFLRCREAGIPVYATPLVETIHLMPKGIQDQDYIPNWFATEEVALPVPALVGG